MKEEVYAPECGREAELIAFLYGELDPGQTIGFRSHMQECPSCSTELNEFTSIRESVVAWRNEALSGVVSPVAQSSSVPARAAQPGALTALREFFNLSPLWMKGAVVFASILFCLFAVLAAARWRETTPPPFAANSNDKIRSEQELNALVDRRVQDELDRIKRSSEQAGTPSVTKESSNHAFGKSAVTRSKEVASKSTEQKARRPLTKVERQELAADLRLIDNTNEGALDLLDDRINQ